MKKINLKFGSRACPIIIGANAIKTIATYLPRQQTKIYILSDKKLTRARRQLIGILKTSNHLIYEIPLKAGESLKSLKAIDSIVGELIKKKADRHSLIMALGGGTIGDVAGFVAATYMRGIPWIGIPTTLLAQVDSSVGGKTGINHISGKNLIGSFHQPQLVICDTQYLKTLGPREFNSGVGEIVKYALTFDQDFFQYLQKNMGALLKRNPKVVSHVVEKSLKWKASVVAKDEYDRKGIREVLNFGHTFGHALEAYTDYKSYQHGEAVIWGMRYALALSIQRGHLGIKDFARMDAELSSIKIVRLPRGLRFQDILALMKTDKKSLQHHVRFVLLDKIGHAILDHQVSEDDLKIAFEFLKRGSK